MNPSVIITGASDGIGRGMAMAFARRGYKVGLLARRKELLEAVAQDCKVAGARLVKIAIADVTQTAQQRAALLELDGALGGVEIFVANAGVGFESKPYEDCGTGTRLLFEVNVLGAIDGLEFMKVRFLERRAGTLVGVSSVAASRGFKGAAAYCASKAALTSYLQSMRADLVPKGIRVTTVAPGFIDTAMTRKNKFWMPFLMSPMRAGEIFARDSIRGKRISIAPFPYRLAYPLIRMIP